MLLFQKSPLLLLAFCMVIGIIAANQIGISYVCMGSLPFVAMWLLYYIFSAKFTGVIGEKMADIGICGTFVGIGALAVLWVDKPDFAQIDSLSHQKVKLSGVLLADAKPTKYGISSRIQLFGFAQADQWQPASLTLQVFADSSFASHWSKDDSVFLWAYVKPLKSKNEHYLTYLKKNGIYLTANALEAKTGGKHKTFSYHLSIIQRNIYNKIFEVMPDSSTAGIAAAMFLGRTDFLDADMNEDFRTAGVSHILAISGQHISVIFMLLNWIFVPLHYLRGGKKSKYGLILGLLVIYMFLCGASASVVRSISMFVLILIAKLFRKRYDILNLMGLAAIIQLVLSPMIVYNLGFQLSYLAVLGIVLFFPLFEAHFFTPYPLLNHVYSWIGVTLCAQVFTFPILVYTFEAFPTYFLLSNVLLALLGYVAVLMGFIMIMTLWIPYLSLLPAYLTHYTLSGMMGITHHIALLPHAVISKADYSGVGILLLQLLFTFVILYLPKWISKKEYLPNLREGLAKWGLE